MTPIPYKLVTIASGVAKFNLVLFALASTGSRAMRFFSVAALLYFGGAPAKRFIEKRLTLVTTVIAVLLVGGVLLVRLI